MEDCAISAKMIADYKADGNFDELFDELNILSNVRRKRLVQLADDHMDTLRATFGEERLELTQETAATAFNMLRLRDAGGIWACMSSDELLAWLKAEFHDEKDIEAFRAKGDVKFQKYLVDQDDKVQRFHELLLDGASDFTAARLLVFDFVKFLSAKGLVMVKKKKFYTMLKCKQGISFFCLAARVVLRDPAHALRAFRFERELGRGAFGLVWKVCDKVEGQPYCIKVVALGEKTKRELEVSTITKLKDARAEFEMMNRIKHENFVNVLDFGEEADIFWYQLEFCEGGDLEKRLHHAQIKKRGPVEEPVLFRWMRECIAGLVAIHDAKIMHRDIKPENILLTMHDDMSAQCKLGDMGLACFVKVTSAFEIREFVGTKFYMAPEVLYDEGYSARADVFSLGMVLFELACCGAREFDNKASIEKYDELFGKLPDGRGKALTVKALQRNKRDRFSSYELLELAQSLDLLELVEGLESEPTASFVRGDYFAYIAVASPPFLLANGIAFAKQLKFIEGRLQLEQDAWLKSGRCPVCLSDADSTVAGADLQACRSRVFVWCATGHGWESRAGTKALTLHDLVDTLKNVQLLIVCQKYGARSAAEYAITKDVVKTVVWISGDIHGHDGSDIFFTIIVPLLDIAKVHSPTTDVLRQVISESGVKTIGHYGVVGDESASYGEWLTRMASPSGWLHVKVQDGLLEQWTRELDSSLLRSLEVFSCDISQATRLKLILNTEADEAGDGHLKCVWVTGSSAKEETRDSRCRAVALDVCESFTFSGQHSGPFQLIRRISNEQEIATVETMLPDLAHPRHVLLWVDLLCDGGLISTDEEYAHDLLVTTLESIAARTKRTVVIFTNDKDSVTDLEAIIEKLTADGDARFDIGEEEGVQGVEAANTHADAITLSADNPSALENFDLLRDALEKCLPSVPIAALYLNDGGGIVVRFCVSDVALLHRLAALVLTGRLP